MATFGLVVGGWGGHTLASSDLYVYPTFSSYAKQLSFTGDVADA